MCEHRVERQFEPAASGSDEIGHLGRHEAEFRLGVRRRQARKVLLVAVIALTVLSLVGHWAVYFLPDFPVRDAFSRKFALNKEQTFPTLFSSLLLAANAVLFFCIARFTSRHRGPYRKHWEVLGWLFLWLAVDELIGLHELMSRPLHQMGVNGFFHNAWLIPGTIILTAIGIAYLRFFFQLPRRTKSKILLAAALMIGGGFGVELFDGYYAFLHGRDNFGYAFFSTIEEVLEMLGGVYLIDALLDYMSALKIEKITLRVRLKKAS